MILLRPVSCKLYRRGLVKGRCFRLPFHGYLYNSFRTFSSWLDSNVFITIRVQVRYIFTLEFVYIGRRGEGCLIQRVRLNEVFVEVVLIHEVVLLTVARRDCRLVVGLDQEGITVLVKGDVNLRVVIVDFTAQQE